MCFSRSRQASLITAVINGCDDVSWLAKGNNSAISSSVISVISYFERKKIYFWAYWDFFSPHRCISWDNLVTVLFLMLWNLLQPSTEYRYHLFCHLVIVVIFHFLPRVVRWLWQSSRSRHAVVRQSSSSRQAVFTVQTVNKLSSPVNWEAFQSCLILMKLTLRLPWELSQDFWCEYVSKNSYFTRKIRLVRIHWSSKLKRCTLLPI